MEKKLNILIVDGDVSEAEELENELNREFDIVGTVFSAFSEIDMLLSFKIMIKFVSILAALFSASYAIPPFSAPSPITETTVLVLP